MYGLDSVRRQAHAGRRKQGGAQGRYTARDAPWPASVAGVPWPCRLSGRGLPALRQRRGEPAGAGVHRRCRWHRGADRRRNAASAGGGSVDQGQRPAVADQRRQPRHQPVDAGAHHRRRPDIVPVLRRPGLCRARHDRQCPNDGGMGAVARYRPDRPGNERLSYSAGDDGARRRFRRTGDRAVSRLAAEVVARQWFPEPAGPPAAAPGRGPRVRPGPGSRAGELRRGAARAGPGPPRAAGRAGRRHRGAARSPGLVRAGGRRGRDGVRVAGRSAVGPGAGPEPRGGRPGAARGLPMPSANSRSTSGSATAERRASTIRDASRRAWSAPIVPTPTTPTRSPSRRPRPPSGP